ncbi:hypothetical protein [Mycoplasmopsis primatum]|uniref:hypothetical protein n=1 Tax=Mycoplasmopsis primatum TaxID=55604 RepID=UPI000495060F|nr:hypothetical protein [Mycoplasmopsis primatum]
MKKIKFLTPLASILPLSIVSVSCNNEEKKEAQKFFEVEKNKESINLKIDASINENKKLEKVFTPEIRKDIDKLIEDVATHLYGLLKEFDIKDEFKDIFNWITETIDISNKQGVDKLISMFKSADFLVKIHEKVNPLISKILNDKQVVKILEKYNINTKDSLAILVSLTTKAMSIFQGLEINDEKSKELFKIFGIDLLKMPEFNFSTKKEIIDFVKKIINNVDSKSISAFFNKLLEDSKAIKEDKDLIIELLSNITTRIIKHIKPVATLCTNLLEKLNWDELLKVNI